ncbi:MULTISPECIES: acylphosphatase [Anaerorhabdus]|uniref:Acylphosphatase n=1 Tax=Anaerorhabdus furcosa TaxID=118967 RepID=A0A1T4LPZ7_9FIRM|nr:acylphosphatase [Anaerorhabdus furcosa]SJZ56534.1 acylphosphatase [Anaerorhabdus furcosa]
MKRYFIIVEGQVQGVGFRNYTQMNAMKNNCTGWVRNMDNGMVEIQIQGEVEKIDKVLRILREGNHFIKVTNITIKEIPLNPNERFFKYR